MKKKAIIVANIKAVDKVILSIDTNRKLCETLKLITDKYKAEFELAFANGGDQSNDKITERAICAEIEIALIDGFGDKIQSSNWLLK